MTVVCNVTTVVDSISKLTISLGTSNLTIKDLDQIPQSAQNLTPLMLPQPDNFMSNVRPVFQSLGSNGSAAIDLGYTLTYVYLHCEAGSGVGAFDVYSGLISNVAAIIAGILSNDAITGLVDLQLGDVGKVGIIEDPAGNQFWGVIFTLNVLEFAK